MEVEEKKMTRIKRKIKIITPRGIT